MKTKRIKRMIAGLLAFAVVLTGGSFGDVKNAKADTISAFKISCTVLVPKENADLSAQSKGMLYASPSTLNTSI